MPCTRAEVTEQLWNHVSPSSSAYVPGIECRLSGWNSSVFALDSISLLLQLGSVKQGLTSTGWPQPLEHWDLKLSL